MKLGLSGFQVLGGASLVAEDCNTLAEACQIAAVPLGTFYQRKDYTYCWLLSKQEMWHCMPTACAAAEAAEHVAFAHLLISTSAASHDSSCLRSSRPAALYLPESNSWRYKSKP